MNSKGGRYQVGIDLGTTHTVVAYGEKGSSEPAQIFEIPQLEDAQRAVPAALLPSALYLRLPNEQAKEPFSAIDDQYLGGRYGLERGNEVVGRLVASAKSWLCHRHVDRNSAILPWGSEAEEGAPPLAKISPINASARYLRHVRAAWDEAFSNHPLQQQSLVVTVPASFDAAARAFTLEACARAGLFPRLLEEPQAAFYDYLRAAGAGELLGKLGALGRPGRILVCDIGGGTTDLSLLIAKAVDGELRVARQAVGEHLLLGGDNVDLALAHMLEPQILKHVVGAKLKPGEFAQLTMEARKAKEKLLADNAPERTTVTLLGKGSKLFGSKRSAALTRAEVISLMEEGFLPLVPPTEKLQRRRGALRSFGLPYAQDAAISRHIGAFFHANQEAPEVDFLLLNGGPFRASMVGQRLRRLIESWTGELPHTLAHTDPDLAVARGAVAYARACEGQGLRITSGAARSYYLGAAQGQEMRGVCILPFGTPAEAPTACPQPLELSRGQKARFELFVARGRRSEACGDTVAITEEEFLRLPPLSAEIARLPGESARTAVKLVAQLGEVGSLQVACVNQAGQTYDLSFEVRGQEAQTQAASVAPTTLRAGPSLQRAEEAIAKLYGKTKSGEGPEKAKDLLRYLEKHYGAKGEWDGAFSRKLFDCVIRHGKGRRRSLDHERMFFQLAGYCLRPGIGHPGDGDRCKRLVPLFFAGLTHRETRVWQSFFIAIRRIAAGIVAEEQENLYGRYEPYLLEKKKKGKSVPGALEELLTLSAHLEHLPTSEKRKLGQFLLEKMWSHEDPLLRVAVGRVGARVLSYAPAQLVLPAKDAESFLEELLGETWKPRSPHGAAAVRLCRMTGDRARDVRPALRAKTLEKLKEIKVPDHWLAQTQEVVEDDLAGAEERFGEALPLGLTLPSALEAG